MSSLTEAADVSCGNISQPEAARSRTHCLPVLFNYGSASSADDLGKVERADVVANDHVACFLLVISYPNKTKCLLRHVPVRDGHLA